MTPAERYLRLSVAYCDFLGGVRWSTQEETLEYQDGTTFAFTEEVALFLEGFSSSGRLIHFCFVLHLLHLFRNSVGPVLPGGWRLMDVFADKNRQLRNAGAFCAMLCRDVPEASGPPHVTDLLARLRDLVRPVRWFVGMFHDTYGPAESPPLGPSVFEQAILRRLEAYTVEELGQWLRHGRGPVKNAGNALARALPPPRTLAGALAALLDRPRLAGARRFVDQMRGVLTLPPRPHRQSEVALGGYADVTTKGQPHLLLPSQFALDELDFLRRYADHELLYFRRDEPHAHTRHELVVLLDQGVRTWGDVRLVLQAAVLALGRRAGDAKLPFFVAATSGNGAVIDPLDTSEEALGNLVEASDLSANPGLALERVLQRRGNGTQDVVLLTHPRNLAEEDVRAAALRAGGPTRLLALTLDGRGQAALSDVRHGVPIELRQFRVDFSAIAPEKPPAPAGKWSDWKGDVEPLGFPFRFGPGVPVGASLFDFDHDVKWLLTATRDGMLHAWKIDGFGHMEVLPRAMVKANVFTNVENIVGVAGGFVVSGRQHQHLVVAHYDLHQRSCKVHLLAEVAGRHTWHYSPEHHVVVLGTPKSGPAVAIDLGTGARHPGDTIVAAPRAQAAWNGLAEGRVPARMQQCLTHPYTGAALEQLYGCFLNAKQGSLELLGFQPPCDALVPLANGRPLLAGCTLLAAEYRANILAAKVRGPGGEIKLYLFHVTTGAVLAEYLESNEGYGFTLSSDGRFLARQFGGWRVEVRETRGDRVPLVITHGGGYSFPTQFILGNYWLLLRAGKQSLHTIHWHGGMLHLRCANADQGWPANAANTADNDLDASGNPGTQADIPESLKYDQQRFLLASTTTVTAVLDQFGQAAIFDKKHQLVCMFFVFRNRISAWMPDGTSFGPASPSGRAPTPADLVKVGRALARASEGKGG